MHLFTDYIQPLTVWLYAHPHWALFITFLVAFSESLAIVGSIIPGSVTMTTIGILAGSGVMRIDLTFLAATLGAIAGDSGSYALGYLFSDRLTNMWPFKNYPSWLLYGQDYFARYGSASVLIGRFVGPLRSIIPAVAGMMHMNHWHFLFANTLSAIGWAILYVTPGVLIGAASSELSTESATRLFILILILLLMVWVLSIGIKWTLIHTHQFLRTNLHDTWMQFKKRPYVTHLVSKITPRYEKNHYPTAGLTLLCLVCFSISLVLIGLVIQGTWVAGLNKAIYLFFQSLRSRSLEDFFLIISLIISSPALVTLISTLIACALYYKDWRFMRYWLSLSIISTLIIFSLNFSINIPKPTNISKYHNLLLFPEVNLTFATALLGFLIFYLRTHYQNASILALRVILTAVLFLAGMSIVYLGDNWLINVITSYFIGLTLCFSHWILYRRDIKIQLRTPLPILLSFLLVLAAVYASYSLYFKKLVQIHSPHLTQYVITEEVWWNQQQPLLPIYSTNRIGQKRGLLNIQYLGAIKTLQQTLETHHWKQQPDSFFYSLLIRAGGSTKNGKVPLMAQFYQNKKPTLVMTYKPYNNPNILLVLRLWPSNYYIRQENQPIWLGSLDYFFQSHKGQWSKNPEQQNSLNVTHAYLKQTLPKFKFNQITLPTEYISSPTPLTSSILLIKEPRGVDITMFTLPKTLELFPLVLKM